MKFYPRKMIEPGQIVIHYVATPVRADWWNEPKLWPNIIDNLFAHLEGRAFERDYAMLGPVHLKAEELAHFNSYQVVLSVPMMRAEDWEDTLVFNEAIKHAPIVKSVQLGSSIKDGSDPKVNEKLARLEDMHGTMGELLGVTDVTLDDK